MDNSRGNQTAGLIRRIAALGYDILLVASLLMFVTLVFVGLRGGNTITPGSLLYQFALIATTAGFFVGFWVHGGQTLGMRAWRLKIEQRSGEALTWRIGMIRFGAGILSMLPLGLGMIWLLFDSDGLTWHDRIAGTQVVLLPKMA